jgi:DUF1707 SHOCT-like domain
VKQKGREKMANNSYEYPRQAPRDRGLRASDRDRQAVGEILRHHNVAGRIDIDEFSERLGRSLSAKTYAELDDLVADLPSEEAVTATGEGPAWSTARAWRGGSLPPWSARSGRSGRSAWSGWAWPAWRFVAVAALVAATAVLTGGRLAWLAFPLFFLFVVRPLLWHRPGLGYRGWSGPCGTGYGGQA